MKANQRFIMLVGVPGSGKSTYGKELVSSNDNFVYLASDDVREMLYGDASIQKDPGVVFQKLQDMALDALSNGVNVVYDATNVTRKSRRGILNRIPRHISAEAHVVYASIQECVERDQSRDRTVGEAVIDKMLKRFQAPFFDEGFSDIKIINTSKMSGLQHAFDMVAAMHIEHDNPHHTLNVIEHSIDAMRHAMALTKDADLINAAQWHDIGKPYTKSFTNYKGESTDMAHYYSHNSVGAWMSYGLHMANAYVAWLISTHMEPYFNSKYYQKLPEALKQDIDMLHMFDLLAH